MTRVCAGLTGLLVFAFGCGSSSAVEPTDPVAIAYCAECSELPNCERLINETILAACTEETLDWYSCTTATATDGVCDFTACDAEFDAREVCLRRAPKDRVAARIFARRPSANLGHRGTGATREGHPFPENSISSFRAAMKEGADGISFDVEITQDGKLIIMHDDTLNRTTDCSGCVSAMTFDQIRACRLVDGADEPTEERPPTLLEAYSAIGANAIMDLELKVFDTACLTDTTGPQQLASAVLEEVTQIGGEGRTIFSSFNESVAAFIKSARPGYYSALLSANPDDPELDLVQTALDLNQDAIHPLFSVSADTVQEALDAGLQVNVWTVDGARLMQEQIDKKATSIITNEPAVLAEVLGR